MLVYRGQFARIAGVTSFLIAVALIAACGGGGGGGGAAPTPPALSSDASLSSLSVTGATLGPAFSASVTSYMASVPNSSSSVDITAATAHRSASATINGGSSTAVSLNVGSNAITIVVTAEDRSTTRTYTIEITRAQSDNANLSNLLLTGAALDPAFDPGTFDYSATVESTVTTIQVTPTAEEGTASIEVDGASLATGATSNPIALNLGDNLVNVLVTAQDGVSTQSYIVNVTRQPALTIAQEAYIKASNTDPDDNFGWIALSADGTTLAVVASSEDSSATGINGDQTDNSLANSGAVYVFTRDSGGVWTQQAYIKTSNPGSLDLFIGAIALSANGSTLVVGAMSEDSAAVGINGDQSNNSAPEAGAAYVFARDGGGTWSQQAYVKASNTEAGDQFGWTVAVSGDGTLLAVGAVTEDSAATGVDGDQTDNSVSAAGAVYVFERSGGGFWAQQAYIKSSNPDDSDHFGDDIAFSADGSTLVIGAAYEDSIATGINGDQSDNSASAAGAVYVFTRNGGVTWVQQAYVKPSNTDNFFSHRFGFAIALSEDGSTMVIGAPREDSAATGVNGDQSDNSAQWSGATYVFTRDNLGTWAQEAYIKASNTDSDDLFGQYVAVSSDGSTLAVTALWESGGATGINGDQSDNSMISAGAVYLFTRTGGGTWSQQAYIKASNTNANDFFGFFVALSADGLTLVAGGLLEGSSATGINGDQSDNSALSAGAAYVFSL